MKKTALFLGITCSTSIAHADAPAIITDIAPVQSLAAMVSGDLGVPSRLMTQAGSTHDLALKPSQAREIAKADLIIWVGPDLSPGLERSFDALAPDVVRLTLSETDGTIRLNYRDADDFGLDHHDDEHADEHGHKEDHDEEHDHADEHKDEHEHDEEHDHADEHKDEHADEHGHDDEHDHAHDGVDPHLWLDPANAAVWVDAIAKALSDLDPENATTYMANAESAKSEIVSLQTTIEAQLNELEGAPLLVAHDAYQYFEAAFDLEVLGSVSDSDAKASGPARLAELKELVEEQKPACIILDPSTDTDLVAAVADSSVPTIAVDPAGTDLPEGSGQYAALMGGMAQALVDCAKP